MTITTGTSTVSRNIVRVRTGAKSFRFEFAHIKERRIKPRRAPNSMAVKADAEVEMILRKNHLNYCVSDFHTTVRVLDGDTVVAKGIAYCWAPDNMNKATGRIHALHNAVKDMPRLQRKEIFTAYETSRTVSGKN